VRSRGPEDGRGGETLSPDRPWTVETRGLSPVPDEDRHGRPAELFWVWLAANLGIIGVVYGAIIASLGIDLWEGVGVAVVGSVLSFLLVGVLGVAGQQAGLPMLVLSQSPFGRRGNVGPAVVSWVSLVGWETITAVIAGDALAALAERTLRLAPSSALAFVALVVVASISLVLGRLGHATIVVVQRLVAWTFGLLTLLICPELVRRAHWSALLKVHPGPHLAWLSGLSIVIASGGISWVNLSADYSRYLPRRESGAKVVWWTTLGAVLPLSALIVVGVLLSSAIPGLAGAANPVAAIGSALPSWMATPYLLAALGGLLSQMVMGLYSSGLGLLVLGVRIRRSRTVLIDTAVVIVVGSLFTIVHHGFLAPFVSFVELLACPIATWAAVFVVDMALRRGRGGSARPVGTGRYGPPSHRGLRLSAVLAWLTGTALGLACTGSPLFTGPLARGLFSGNSLGYFLGFFVSGALYLLAETVTSRRASRAQSLRAAASVPGAGAEAGQ
jgi:purine-cytosine permease-like protein